MEIKILELFGGIGACTKAFKRLGIPHKVVDYVEIDKYAVASYNAINGTNFEPQDICNWNKDIEVDLIMHGSPCQDFSLAGKQAGGDKDSGTRSSLMYETVRIVEKLKPKYVIWENVKNVISKKHKHNFDNYINELNKLGYTSYYQVLNAKDYGIPQNRERVFTISIRNDTKVYGDYFFPTIKTDDKAINFTFPQPQELKLLLKDMLEDEVDEKYYLSEKMVNFFYKNEQIQKEKGNGFRFNVTDGKVIAKTITTRAGSRMDDNFLKIKNATKKGFQEAYDGDSVNLAYPESTTRRGRVGNQVSQTLQCNDSMGVVINLKTKNKRLHSMLDKIDVTKVQAIDMYNQTTHDNEIHTITTRVDASNCTAITQDLGIRKLTPKECWRLMGFDDEDVDRASEVNSNTQLYKQAGNSIVVNVLEAILTNLLLESNQDIPKGQTTIFDYEV